MPTRKKPAKKTAAKKLPAKRVRTRSECVAPFVPSKDEWKATFHNVVETKIPKAAWDSFLQELSERGNVTDSAKVVGIKRITVYKRAERDADFAQALDAAHKMGLKSLEDHAVRRATHGVKQPVFYQGEQIAEVTEYSDSLLQFLLQSNDPKYKRKQEITGADSGPLALLVQLSDEELQAEIDRLKREAKELHNNE